MARRYSESDQRKMVADKMAELRERKIADARNIRNVSPHQTTVEVLDSMLKNPTFVRDQSQAQIEIGKETMKQRENEAKGQA